MQKFIFICVLLISYNSIGMCQSAHKYLRQADKKYLDNDFASAEELYRKADQKKSSLKSSYNLGNSTFQQERYAESIDFYMNAARKSETKAEESDAFYNLGNAYFYNQELEEAIDAFKQSIRLNPNNQEAQYNLTVAKEIKKQMQQQEQEEQESEDSDSENQEDQEQQEQQDQESESEENNEQQDQDSDEQQPEQQDSTQQIQESNFDSTRLDKQSLDSLDAAKLLQIIQSEEQKVQEKLRKFNSNRKKPDKDW